MTETESYVRRYLKEALAKVETSPIAGVGNGLDIFEKTLIYYYTESGYREINSGIRQSHGKRVSKVSALLNVALEKLPDWHGLSYRYTALTRKDIERYRFSLETATPLTEWSFVSCSASLGKAHAYPGSNTEFRIRLRHGKDVEECSCLGKHTPPNEEEILIPSGLIFQVLDVKRFRPIGVDYHERIIAMLKTKSTAMKSRNPLAKAGSQPRSQPRIVRATPSRPARNGSGRLTMDSLLRGLKTQIARLIDYIEATPLSREDELFFISQLHTLNVLRDKLEMMKNPLTKEELAMVSEHMFRKAQSAFSD